MYSRALSQDDILALIAEDCINSPPEVWSGENVSIASEEIPSTIITGTATDADGDELFYQWFENGFQLSALAPVLSDNTCPLELMDVSYQLRSERSGDGSGRKYSITITATDNSENSSTVQVYVIVPHDMRKN